MKRFLSLLIAIAIVISMTVQGIAASSSQSAALLPTNIPKVFPVVKQDSSAKVLSFWNTMTGRYATTLQNIVNWFNATEGKTKKIYIKAIYQGSLTEIPIKVQAAIQSKNVSSLPDIAQFSPSAFFSVKESDRVAYVEEYMNSDPAFKGMKDKLNKNALFGCSYKGKQAGLPFSNSMIMFHYNVPAFKAVGLDPDNPPKTLAEYADAAKKLMIKGSGKKPVRYGACDKVVTYHLSTFIPRQGAGYEFNNENGRLGTPTEYSCAKNGTLKATLTEWKKVLDTGAVEFYTGSSRAYLESGLAAMGLFSMVSYDTIDSYFAGLKDKSKAFEHRMTRIPTVNTNDAVGEAIGGSAIYMFDKGDKSSMDASWQFLKFLCTVDVSSYWYVNSGYFPLNNDAGKTKYVSDSLKSKPNKLAVLKVLADSKDCYKFQDPLMPSYDPYSAHVGDQIALMGQGKQTVETTLNSIANKVERILNSYKLAQ